MCLYYLGDTELHFACDSKGIPQKDEMIKLYLSSDDLVRSITNSMCFTILCTPFKSKCETSSIVLFSNIFYYFQTSEGEIRYK